MSQMIPMSREQLQQEGVDGNKRAQIHGMIQRVYHTIVVAARAGQTEYFMPVPEKTPIAIKLPGGIGTWSNDTFISHQDIIQELSKVFPGVTIMSVEKKGTQQVVYQQAGILLNWS